MTDVTVTCNNYNLCKTDGSKTIDSCNSVFSIITMDGHYAFSALTLLVGWQEEYLAHQNIEQ